MIARVIRVGFAVVALLGIGALLGTISPVRKPVPLAATAGASLQIDPYAWELGGIARDSIDSQLWSWIGAGLSSSGSSADKGLGHERLADFWRFRNRARGDAERARAQYWAERVVSSQPVDPNAWSTDGLRHRAPTAEEENLSALVDRARQSAAGDEDRATVHSLLARYYIRKGDKTTGAVELMRALYWTRADILHFGR